jgi:hypothetical protein
MQKKINPELLKVLEEKNLYSPDYICALFSIEYLSELPSYFPPNLLYHLDLAGLVSKDAATLKYVLTFPLFLSEEVRTKDLRWDWVREWRDMFKNAYSERAGSPSTCIARMKTFFSENPEVRKEDVFSATMLYLESIQDAKYLTTSHKFIYDGAGKSRNSRLEEWIEKYKEVLEASKQINQNMSLHISDIMK